MTILEALKKIKHLDRKIEKTHKRISRWCSYVDTDNPLYDSGDVKRMLQSVEDLIRERNRLRHLIHKTNIATVVTFQHKEFTLDELLILRTLTLPAKLASVTLLRRREKGFNDPKEAKVVLQYDPRERDKNIESIENTIDELDAFLDSVNITTNLVD